MISDEEREALQYFNTETKTEAMHYGAVLVKLIEKQSKEIEKLDYKNAREFRQATKERDEYWKDKIKAKIEEVNYKMIGHQDVREAVKQVLQSLLEEEE